MDMEKVRRLPGLVEQLDQEGLVDKWELIKNILEILFMVMGKIKDIFMQPSEPQPEPVEKKA
jgi:hypothetical protein